MLKKDLQEAKRYDVQMLKQHVANVLFNLLIDEVTSKMLKPVQKLFEKLDIK